LLTGVFSLRAKLKTISEQFDARDLHYRGLLRKVIENVRFIQIDIHLFAAGVPFRSHDVLNVIEETPGRTCQLNNLVG
jgi:hypothetical protein